MKIRKLISVTFFTALTIASVYAGGKKDKLFQTVETGNVKEIKQALKKNRDYANITKGDEKQTLLMAAIKDDRSLEIINVLLKYGADPSKKDKLKRNSIFYSAQYSSQPEVLERLIKYDAPFGITKKNRIVKKDKTGKTAFDYARMNKDPEAMLKVLNKFAKEPAVRQKAKNNTSTEETEAQQDEIEPLEEAASEEKTDITSLTEPNTTPGVPADDKIQENQPADKKTVSEETLKEIPAAVSPEFDEDELDDELNYELDTEDSLEQPDNETALNNEDSANKEINPASSETSQVLSTVNDAKKKNSSSVQLTPYKKTYLFDYAELDDEEPPVEDDKNFDPDHIFIENASAKDINGRSKLMKAAKNGNLKLLENLIYSDAEINAKDNDGWTALMFAARFSSDIKITKSLIKNGALVTEKNNYGVSALKLAAGFNKNPGITTEILSKYNASDSEIRSAFVYAITSQASPDVLEVFVKKGLSINSSYDGKTPLMYAAETNSNTKIIKWLLSSGARTTYKTSGGKTAWDFAKENSALPHDDNYWALNNSGEY